MYSEHEIEQLRGATAYDPSDTKVGGVGEVYLDDRTGEPMWVTVNTGFFGTRTSFVPLAGSRLDGDRLVLAHDKDVIKNAPQLDENGHLDRSEEDELYRYYAVESGDAVAGEDRLRTRRWDDGSPGVRQGDVVGGGAAGTVGAAAGGSMFDRDADGRGPVGEMLDGPDGSVSDRRGDLRGDTAGVGTTRDPYATDNRYATDDRLGGDPADFPLVEDDPTLRRGEGGYTAGVDDGPLLDRDRDGRGPVGEVLDGPDDDFGRPRR